MMLISKCTIHQLMNSHSFFPSRTIISTAAIFVPYLSNLSAPTVGIPPAVWGQFNTKMPYQYRNSHCGNKMILRRSYLHNGISYTGNTPQLAVCQDIECFSVQSMFLLTYWRRFYIVLIGPGYNTSWVATGPGGTTFGDDTKVPWPR